MKDKSKAALPDRPENQRILPELVYIILGWERINYLVLGA